MRLTSVTSISLLAGHTLAYRGIDLHNGAALVGRDTSIPTCVSDCVQPSADAAGCNSVDYSCLCASSVFITATAKCLAATCTTSTDIETGVALGQQVGKRDFAKSYTDLSRQTCEAIGISEVIPASASSIIVAAEAGSYTAAASVTSDAAATSTASDKSQTTASGAITSASAAQASNTSTSEAATSGAESLRVPALLAFVGFVVSW
ncbi:uncharacterized protein L969DRAFT_52690 [Mixia osmundae IAM 14324]|uniref:CFEM domain-containing protein n=1 Tax=Mixia osmundae (strain CBS 9802 / IAM 14324 / JCM 22182 / KY 12970) TaxID=764103 RepID=G7E4N9_MIXOS|nr:uncharacterized protein L969DRAFT_52690 [Mixia osmundae IAM 14324]KEI37684.1 hypothetical protein L969DRAFT_52690 [Mixia osmundae IAM 14324]GAA97799.1 hypothetical protein E5Q_04478 [Mixia osmundae IAM 14324]